MKTIIAILICACAYAQQVFPTNPKTAAGWTDNGTTVSTTRNVSVGTTIFVSGTGDISTAINNAVNNCPSLGCAIDASGFTPTGTASATITINKPITLRLPGGVISSAQSPVINATNAASGTSISGLSNNGTQIRYTGSGAADILRCGASTDVSISCAYLTLSDISFMPMEGSVATIDMHFYNPYGIGLNRVWAFHSECTGGLTDVSPSQASCGAGTPLSGSSNIGAKFEMTSTSNAVPPAGQIKISNWASTTGRGSDNAGGSSYGIWFAGRNGTNSAINQVVLDGYADQEATTVGIRADYTATMTIAPTWYINAGTPFVFTSTSPAVDGFYKYSFVKTAGAFFLNGISQGAAPAATSEDFVIAAIGQKVLLDRGVIKTSTACTGTSTATMSVGNTGNAAVLFSAYNLKAAVADGNFALSVGPQNNFGASGAINMTGTLATTGGNVSDIADGCAFDLWVRWINLP